MMRKPESPKVCACGTPPAIWKTSGGYKVACVSSGKGCNVKSVADYNQTYVVRKWNAMIELRTSEIKTPEDLFRKIM